MIERRTIHGAVEQRANEDGFDFGGLASRVGSEYTMHEDDDEVWTEVIDPTAFNSVLNNDVRVLFNHNESQILGRTKAGTAKVWADMDGLRYAWKTPDTSLGKDVAESISRGDIDQSSFGFRTDRKNSVWTRTTLEDGRKKVQRTITKIDELYDVSPVTYPANPDTLVGVRSYEAALKEYREEELKDEELTPQILDSSNNGHLSVDIAEKLTGLKKKISNH